MRPREEKKTGPNRDWLDWPVVHSGPRDWPVIIDSGCVPRKNGLVTGVGPIGLRTGDSGGDLPILFTRTQPTPQAARARSRTTPGDLCAGGGGGADLRDALGVRQPVGPPLPRGANRVMMASASRVFHLAVADAPVAIAALDLGQLVGRGEELEEGNSGQVSGFLGASTGVLSVTIFLHFLRITAGSSKISIVLL